MSPAPKDGSAPSSGLQGLFTVSNVVGAVVVYWLFRTVSRVVYRLYFHPLRNFPGSKLRAATRVPAHIDLWYGTGTKSLAELHRKYGHVVRVSPDELSWTEPDSWKDIYGHGTKGTRGSPPHKDWNNYGKAANGVYNILQTPDDHPRMRKIFNPAFSDRALKQQEPLFVKYVDLLVSKLNANMQQNPFGEIDLVRMFNFTTFDIMGDLTFGEPLHLLETGEYSQWVAVIFKSLVITSRSYILKSYPWVNRVFTGLASQAMNKKLQEHFQHSVDRVTKRLEQGRKTEGVDLWDLVLEQDASKGLSRAEMDANAAVFMFAGTETTATLVAGWTYLLLKNPTAMQKVVTELRTEFAKSSDMDMERLAALPYFNASMKEALRMYPPVPLGLRRITPEDGSTVVGHFIPPGTVLTIPHQVMYLSERNFRDPLVYAPERWLGEKRYEADQRQAVQPFSVGSRDCLGKNMAYHEMRLMVAKVLYSFDLELSPSCENWTDQNVFVLWQKVPLLCKLRLAS